MGTMRTRVKKDGWKTCIAVQVLQIRERCRARCTKVDHVGVGRVLRHQVHPALHEGNQVRQIKRVGVGLAMKEILRLKVE